MNAIAKGVQTAAGGVGFFAGYLWSVAGWAAQSRASHNELVRQALTPGLLLAAGYATLLGLFFWSYLSFPRAGGLRATVAPAAFTLSFALGFLGIRGALCLVGG